MSDTEIRKSSVTVKVIEDLHTFSEVAASTNILASQIRRWREFLRTRDMAMLIACLGEQAVGRANLYWYGVYEKAVVNTVGYVPCLDSLKVNEDYRRQGIGTALIAACEEQVRERPDLPQCMALNVLRDNESAQRLYTRLGYELYEIKDGDYQTYWQDITADGQTIWKSGAALIMFKDLEH